MQEVFQGIRILENKRHRLPMYNDKYTNNPRTGTVSYGLMREVLAIYIKYIASVNSTHWNPDRLVDSLLGYISHRSTIRISSPLDRMR